MSTAEGLEEWTARQRDVLDAALDLIVRGESLTMGSVAKAASCSKETLYKWFGDRDGLLTATVRRQASHVRGRPLPSGKLTRADLSDSLTRFAADWLSVIASPTSVSLNRLAVSHAGTGAADLGAIVLRNGPNAMAARLKPVLEAGRAAKLLDFPDPDEAFRTFFGLVVRDTQIRRLLGDPMAPSAADIERDASGAVAQFFTLFAAPDEATASRPS